MPRNCHPRLPSLIFLRRVTLDFRSIELLLPYSSTSKNAQRPAQSLNTLYSIVFPPFIKMSSFEPSLSTSAMRPPLASAEAPSMADSLPSLNFGFEDLRSRMAQFTAKFDAFIEKGRKQVLQERNQFHSNLAELQSMSLSPDSRLKTVDHMLTIKKRTTT